MMFSLINPRFSDFSLKDFIDKLPDAFETSGKILYSGRNEVRSMTIGGQEFIVKRYKKLSLPRAILYLWRASKAVRAYRYGEEMHKRGILTPTPVAAVDIKRGILLHDSYFISLPCYGQDLTYLRSPDFDKNEVARLSKFILEVQQAGILHGDLNLSNILLVDEKSENVLQRYALIDTNRSKILSPGAHISLKRRAANLMRVTHRRDLLREVLRTFPIEGKCQQKIVRHTFKKLFRREANKRIIRRFFPH